MAVSHSSELCLVFSISVPFLLSFLIVCSYLSYFLSHCCWCNKFVSPIYTVQNVPPVLNIFLIHCLRISSGNGLIIFLSLESLTALSRLSYYVIQGTAVGCCPKRLPHLQFLKEFLISEGWNLDFRFSSLFLQVMGQTTADSVEFSFKFCPDTKQ